LGPIFTLNHNRLPQGPRFIPVILLLLFSFGYVQAQVTDTPSFTPTSTPVILPTATPLVCAVTSGPAVEPASTSATVSWSSSCVGFGQVRYGLTSNLLNLTASDANFSQSHTIGLKGLNAGQLYFYIAATLNQDGVPLVQSGIGTFTTIPFTPTPTPTDTFTAAPTATDTFTSTPTPFDTPTPIPTDSATPTSTFTSTDTPAAPPTVTPTETSTDSPVPAPSTPTPAGCSITEGPSAQPASTSVTLTWSSNCTGFGQARYGLSPVLLNLSSSDAAFSPSHTLVLNGLNDGQLYYYQVATLNQDGVPIAQSATGTFTTIPFTPTPSATPTSSWTPTTTFTPVSTNTPLPTPTVCAILSGPSVQIAADSATITWSSNCTGFGAVHFGVTAKNQNRVATDPKFTPSHSVILFNLSAKKTYYYYVVTLNSDGLVSAQSQVQSFDLIP
jgi:hypothetical protein